MANYNAVQETPAIPPIEMDLTRDQWAKANLAALAVLLNVEENENSILELFPAFNAVFAFNRALVLEEVGNGVHCTAAEPATLADQHWPDQSLGDALNVWSGRAGDAQDAL